MKNNKQSVKLGYLYALTARLTDSDLNVIQFKEPFNFDLYKIFWDDENRLFYKLAWNAERKKKKKINLIYWKIIIQKGNLLDIG